MHSNKITIIASVAIMNGLTDNWQMLPNTQP